MQEKETDIALINAILAGNTNQYAVLVKRHQRFVFTLAMRFAKNREDAEEVAQDCFIKAYKALGTFKQTSKFSTWLYSITKPLICFCLMTLQLLPFFIKESKV